MKKIIKSIIVSCSIIFAFGTVSPTIYAVEREKGVELKDFSSILNELSTKQGDDVRLIPGIFNPTANIERQDFAIIMAKALNLDVSTSIETSTFSDVPVSHYSAIYINAAVEAGLMGGMGNGEFGLGDNLTRQQLAVVFTNVIGVFPSIGSGKLPFKDAESISPWARDAVSYAVSIGLVQGNQDGTFNPSGTATYKHVDALLTRTNDFITNFETKEGPDLTPPSPEPENPTPEPVTPNPKPENPDPVPVTPNPETENPTPAPVNPNPKPENPDPVPVTPNPEPENPTPAPVNPNPEPENSTPVPVNPNPSPNNPNS